MSATPSTGTAPLTVTFDGCGSIPRGNPGIVGLVVRRWQLGHGVQTTHVYPTPGTYTASLTVTDSLGVEHSGNNIHRGQASTPPTPTPTNTPAPGQHKHWFPLTLRKCRTDIQRG